MKYLIKWIVVTITINPTFHSNINSYPIEDKFGRVRDSFAFSSYWKVDTNYYEPKPKLKVFSNRDSAFVFYKEAVIESTKWNYRSKWVTGTPFLTKSLDSCRSCDHSEEYTNIITKVKFDSISIKVKK